MGRRVMVSAELMSLLEETANEIMLQDDGVHGRDWRDECQTSRVSDEKGGVIRLETDHDWIVAFFVWYSGSRSISKKLPRDL